ncbi:hypothetical protein CQW23_31328 [Capsicum baccatum]|uniref:Proteasome subunit beta type-6 n=1 Tax=Capsicum baccatum TaxID=33114 RepID=A0A2G2V7U2_CAPBA|nr:hypothetical protein CQW23_31328 [Capsicum baccatum]
MCWFNIDEPRPSNATTIVGVTYDDGVILGSNDTITQLTSNVVLCHCAQDAEFLFQDARNFILEQENIRATAETIGTMLSAYNTTTRDTLQTGVIIGGAKKIHEISHGGIVLEKSNFGIGGFGASYLHNFMDREWKKGMKVEEAEELVLKTLSLSGIRSYGIQTANVNSRGVTKSFHPYDILPISQEELELQYVIGGKELLEALRACLIS